MRQASATLHLLLSHFYAIRNVDAAAMVVNTKRPKIEYFQLDKHTNEKMNVFRIRKVLMFV